MLVNIEVNDKVIKARKGETIMAALESNGIKIPSLCAMKDFTPTGACRMCVVEVEGKRDWCLPVHSLLPNG
jgi:NADH dehydrogenase/NADH:ubiquinone oxidoreductase subunit G